MKGIVLSNSRIEYKTKMKLSSPIQNHNKPITLTHFSEKKMCNLNQMTNNHQQTHTQATTLILDDNFTRDFCIFIHNNNNHSHMISIIEFPHPHLKTYDILHTI